MNKFKVGDKVYCPHINNRISKITRDNGDGDVFLNLAGWFKDTGLNDNGIPIVFYATEENHTLLEKLYGIEFEKLQVRKEPKQIIQAMFNSGKWFLVNYVIYNNVNQKPKNKVITKQNFHTMNFDDYFNRYAYCNIEVIDPETGKTIIDFVDGKVVLENNDE